jgi:hypothetical protein
MARFVTAGAIDLNLCTYVPLGKSNSQAKSDSWLGQQGAKTKNTKSARTPDIIAGSSSNVYHRYI